MMGTKITVSFEQGSDIVAELHEQHQTVTGGEVGPLRVLLGFSPTTTPDPAAWKFAPAGDLESGTEQPEDLVGWFAQLVDEDGTLFGYNVPITRVVVEQ